MPYSLLQTRLCELLKTRRNGTAASHRIHGRRRYQWINHKLQSSQVKCTAQDPIDEFIFGQFKTRTADWV